MRYITALAGVGIATALSFLLFVPCWGSEVCYRFESRGEAAARKMQHPDNFGLRSGNTGLGFDPTILPLDAESITYAVSLDNNAFHWIAFRSNEQALDGIQKVYVNAHDCSALWETRFSRTGHQVICL